MRLVIEWAHRDYFPVFVYQRGTRGRVLVMGSLGDNARLLHLVRKTDQILCFTVGDYRQPEFEMMRRVAHLFDISLQRLVVLCNYPAQVTMAEAAGLRACYCNKNAFIDENTYRPQLIRKQFDAVSNARLVKSKRVWLAREIGNLAIVQGLCHERTEYDDPADIPHRYLNQDHLTPRALTRVLSASWVGLALSEAEGACRASSEYLLCGLPVVSTPSVGGRDIWYDENNSFVCDPTPVAVRKAVQHMIERQRRGDIDPRSIRDRHIAQALVHRKRFIAATENAFDDVGACADAAEVFQRQFTSTGVAPRYLPHDEIRRELQT